MVRRRRSRVFSVIPGGERELGLTLMDRTTHHVRLTAAGAVFLIDARQILAHVERATVAAQRASRSRPSLRVFKAVRITGHRSTPDQPVSETPRRTVLDMVGAVAALDGPPCVVVRHILGKHPG
jgi:DNA-binding transcriptional LysR family regulator